jgi:membrane protein
MNRKSVWQFLKDVFTKWINVDPFLLASSLSYYTLFSLAPLLIIAIAVAGFVFGHEAAQNQIVETIGGMIGFESAKAVQGMIENASNKPTTGMVSTMLGTAAILVGAGGVVGQLQTSLNMIWGVVPKSGLGVWGFIRQRFISYVMVLAVGFLLLVSLVASALVTGLSQFVGTLIGGAEVVAHTLDVVMSFAFVTLLFGLIYKFVPDIKIEWRDVWIGAGLTSVLFTIGKFLIGLYLGGSGVTSAYGAAGSLITVLLWVYYSALIFVLGAEFTKGYSDAYGSGAVPAENAKIAPRANKRERSSETPEKGRIYGKNRKVDRC